jgi:hypothetical protein
MNQQENRSSALKDNHLIDPLLKEKDIDES